MNLFKFIVLKYVYRKICAVDVSVGRLQEFLKPCFFRVGPIML